MKQSVEIHSILRQFHEISGFRISIHDTDFHEIYCYPAQLSPFCRRMQENADIRRDCLQNDADAFRKVEQTGEPCIYQCKRGLYEAVAPIYHYGVLSGYLMMGQVCDDTQHAARRLTDAAAAVLHNLTDVAALVQTVRVVPLRLMDSYRGIMTVIAEYITETNRLYSCCETLPQLIKEYLDQNYAKKITLSLLAQKFNCCNSSLTKCFKKEYGVTIVSYLQTVRLKNAEKMISGSRKSCKEIAGDCGFSDQNYFSKVFAARFGCSPSQFREMLQ